MELAVQLANLNLQLWTVEEIKSYAFDRLADELEELPRKQLISEIAEMET
jgi:hypothetical protein